MNSSLPKTQRFWLIASLIAGISYFFIKDMALPAIYHVVWKGAGVGLLAVFAWLHGEIVGARTIALVMALGALGDVLIEFSLEAGAAAFLIGHLIAIRFYWRHRRERLAIGQFALAFAILILVPIVAFLLPTDRSGAPLVALYAAGLAAMAASAWTSMFTRYRVGIGAVMFVASDLLIFARSGALVTSTLPNLLIWPLYYFGQFLVCTGVLDGLNGRQERPGHQGAEVAK